jgi:hypothetical protein
VFATATLDSGEGMRHLTAVTIGKSTVALECRALAQYRIGGVFVTDSIDSIQPQVTHHFLQPRCTIAEGSRPPFACDLSESSTGVFKVYHEAQNININSNPTTYLGQLWSNSRRQGMSRTHSQPCQVLQLPKAPWNRMHAPTYTPAAPPALKTVAFNVNLHCICKSRIHQQALRIDVHRMKINRNQAGPLLRLLHCSQMTFF